MNTCKYCKFYKGDIDFGSCHRYPPKEVSKGISLATTYAIFPLVTVADWCGEFVTEEMERE